jgi:putative nucleotidyltransferase with HDIG domain
MLIPTRTQCYELISRMQMLEHIVAHSVQVCRVALFLADRLMEKAIPLNRNLVTASALLHDITKTRSFQTGENHAETGGILLREMGFFEVGEIVRQHVRLDDYFGGEAPDEAEVVNYADKRVLHDRLVPMRDRMAYILEKYGSRPEHRRSLQWLWGQSVEMEKRIFDGLPFGPETIEGSLPASELDAELDRYRSIRQRSESDRV